VQARHMPREAAGSPLIEPPAERPGPRGNVSPPTPAGATTLAAPRSRPGSEPQVAAFRSVLFSPDAPGQRDETADQPEFFRDLNLDKIVAAITAGKGS
jgi:hypothetical protein